MKSIIRKLITLPYLPLVIFYCLAGMFVFFINVQNIGQNNIEPLQYSKVSFDLNKTFGTVSAFIFVNFGLSILAQSYNIKYNHLFFLINLFFLIILYVAIIFSILAPIFKL